MKVLHVITSLEIGGAEKLLVDLLPALRDEGVEAELLLFDGRRTDFYDRLEAQGIRIHSLAQGRGAYDFRHLWGTLRHLHRYDIVHTHNTPCQLYTALASLARRATLVTTEHNTSNRRRAKPWLRPFDRWMFRRYRAIACVSREVEESLSDYLRLPCLNVRTIANGIFYETFAQATPLATLRAQYPSKKIVLSAARLTIQKDHSTLLHAMARLSDDYVLLLAGRGEREAELRSLAAKLGIAQRVIFLGVRSDIPALLATADVLVQSTHYEGLSLAVLESMASGRPLVASDVAGVREVVAGAGVLVPPRNATALADAIVRLCTDETYCAATVAACQSRAMQYDIRHTAQGYLRLYKQLLS